MLWTARSVQVRFGVLDPSLTRVLGMSAVTELANRLDMVKLLNAAIGPIKPRDHGHLNSELLIV